MSLARRFWREALLAALLTLPWLSLLVLGGLWQWQNSAGLVWGLAIAAPTRPKAKLIADAVRAVAQSFGVGDGDVVPIALPQGLAPYNIDQLWGVIAASLAEGRQRQLERLRAQRSGLSLAELAAQIGRSARLLARLATKGSG